MDKSNITLGTNGTVMATNFMAQSVNALSEGNLPGGIFFGVLCGVIAIGAIVINVKYCMRRDKTKPGFGIDSREFEDRLEAQLPNTSEDSNSKSNSPNNSPEELDITEVPRNSEPGTPGIPIEADEAITFTTEDKFSILMDIFSN